MNNFIYLLFYFILFYFFFCLKYDRTKRFLNEITNTTKLLLNLTQQIDNMNLSINKALSGLQTDYSKEKKEEISDFEVQGNNNNNNKKSFLNNIIFLFYFYFFILD